MRRRYAVVLVHARRFKPTVMLNATGQLKIVKLHFIRRTDGANAGIASGHNMLPLEAVGSLKMESLLR